MINSHTDIIRRRTGAAFAAFAVVLLTSLTAAEAATVTLQWDSNTESDLAGYTIVYGTTSRQYAESVDVGNRTSYQFTNLEGGRTYYFAVRAYNRSGMQSGFSAEVSTNTILGPLALRNFVANLTSPRAVGTTLVFAAAPSDGTAPYQYKWMISDGSTTTVVQNWSGSSTYTWQPYIPKSYTVSVWVRNSTSTADTAENTSSTGSLPFVITQPGAQGGGGTLSISSLTADRPAPQQPGATINFTASATGGTAPYQYRWLVSNGAAWRVTQNWSSNSRFAWTPVFMSSAYMVRVQARSANSVIDAPDNGSSDRTMPFDITSDVATSIAVTSDKDAPQPAGTPIRFTAGAFGGGAVYEYQWSVFDGTRWSVLQDWSGTNTFTWTPSSPNARYQVMVRVRGGRDLAANAGVSQPFAIQ